MKNRPRLAKRLILKSALLILQGLYREPKYKVSLEGGTIYVDQIFKDFDDIALVIRVEVF